MPARPRDDWKSSGPNELRRRARRGWPAELLGQFTHPLALLLWGAAGLSVISGSAVLAWTIVAVIALNALFAFAQERQAERAVEALAVLFRTAEGTKPLSVVIDKHVAFEADSHSLDEGWSVIVQGTAEVLSTSAQINEADRAGLRPWVATLKLRYVRIHAASISGRRFRFGSEPDREDTLA
jgi:uncharacterized protein